MPRLSGSCVTTPLLHSAMGPHFPCLPFPAYGLTEALLWLPLQVQPQVGFGFLNHTLDSVAVFLPGQLSLLPPSFLRSSCAKSSLFLHAGFLAFLLDFLLRLHCSWPWRRWSLTSNQFCWTPLPSRPQSQGSVSSGSLKRFVSWSLLCCTYFIKHNCMQQCILIFCHLLSEILLWIRTLLSQPTHQLWYLECCKFFF